ncbi:MAG: CoA transferase, partial [Actinobacteria bacterium]|nr:CoA transferase [Actinomycetota bacterium]
MSAGDGPLAGIRILELGSFVAGPFAGQLLGDLGAEVIKIESPEPGDPMRRWGVLLDGRSIWWSALARNKRLVAVDLRLPEGRAVVRRLALTSDVVLENFTPGRLEEWGLAYQELAKVNPRLVMTRVSGFGQSGPRAGEPGFGSIGEAMGGLRELTGSPDRPPARAAVSMGDQISGLFAAFGTLAALRQVERDGHGQIVDVALYEAV